MSDEPTTRDRVLAVLQGQSPDYFAFPNASAFVADGLDPADVAGVLAELHRDGVVEREVLLVPTTDGAADGEGEHVHGGYRLTREGGDMDETSEPTEPTEPEPDDDDGDEDE